MKSRKSFLIFLLTIMSLSLFAFSGGTGTENDPYKIGSLADLQELSGNDGYWAAGNYFIQTTDIDASAEVNFSPIGNDPNTFQGVYDGNGFTITNITVTGGSNPNNGLFGSVANATIKNLGVLDVAVSGSRSTGALVGKCSESVISNCFSSGTVTSNTQWYSGGLIGYSISNSQVTNCYSRARVIGTYSSGGLIGEINGSTIQNSYSTGQVSGSLQIGGFVGHALGEYTVENSFWNTTTSSNFSSVVGTGITSDNMQTQSTFANAGWDLANTWNMDAGVNDGFPYLIYDSITFLAGDGSENNPYQIATLDNLRKLSEDSEYWAAGNYFIQTANIDASAEANFSPIGSSFTPFQGHYNGDNHTISNLTISSFADNKGLFGYTNGCTISNLGLVSVSVSGNNHVGALVGNDNNSTITNCYATGTIDANGNSVGGLIGKSLTNSNITKCYSTCSVSGGADVGGFIGYFSTNSTISESFATGTVSSSSNNVAGFVGQLIGSSTVENCYSLGNVIRTSGASEYYGSFCGVISDNSGASTIENCYSTGSVNYGTTKGFVGVESGTNTFTSNFFDSQTTLQTSGTGAMSATTAAMKTVSTFTDAGWNFATVWGMNAGVNNGYPYLINSNDDQTLPVEMSSFFATQSSSDSALLSWTTESETELLGYNVLRNENSALTEASRMNSSVIAGQNNTTTTNYSYDDQSVYMERTYYYWLEAVNMDGTNEFFGPVTVTLKSDEDDSPELQTEITELKTAYPNPFNPSTTISFNVKEGEKGQLSIFNIRGQIVLKKEFNAGSHAYIWNAQNNASGVYFYKLQSDSYSKVKKVMMMK